MTKTSANVVEIVEITQRIHPGVLGCWSNPSKDIEVARI